MSECIRWWGSNKNSKGYGTESLKNPWTGRQRSAHRLAWEECFGEIPKGLHVLHKCDNTWCVNPEHLFLGTNKDNVDDRVRKGRSSRRCGEKNPSSKISDDERHWVRKTVMAGATQLETAKILGIANTRVSQIVRDDWYG